MKEAKNGKSPQANKVCKVDSGQPAARVFSGFLSYRYDIFVSRFSGYSASCSETQKSGVPSEPKYGIRFK